MDYRPNTQNPRPPPSVRRVEPVIRRLTLALNTNADQLIFDPDEHTPNDWQLRLQAITHLDPDEQHAIRTVIDGILIRHQARKLAS
jgi:hypothetical protein